MHFEGDAFISYAHLDNVELVEGGKGWVANLHRALEVRVAQLLGKTPHIWRDPKLKGNDLFADTLVDRLQHVALLISVVSPRYVKSDWTLRELNEFWSAAEKQGGVRVRDRARVFKVLKTPVPLEKTPPRLQQLLGYEFFKVDPDTGKIRELNEVFGSDAQREFWVKLDDLAHDICELLESIDEIAGVDAQADARRLEPEDAEAVYLAATTSDLREQRESIRRDLQQHGYTVLPDRVLPHVSDELEVAVREDLARCCMSIHLIGRIYSFVPEGGAASLVEVQHELATERAAQGSFARLLWMPDAITIDDERQKVVVQRLRRDPRIQGNADFLETFFEDLRTAIQDWMHREQQRREQLKREHAVDAASAVIDVAQPPAAAPPPRLYLIADQRDGSVLSPWADALFQEHIEVIRPIFEGDEAEIREYHEENLAQCDGVLILYGAGNELWLRRKLRELQKSPGYGRTKPPAKTAICLINPKTPEKEAFKTHDAAVIPQWDGVGLAALRSFITQLKAGGAV
jgi:hypothetical protein